ncbi:ATP-dependent endonuclease [Bacillus anthracis]|nr:ATP-dependent endonuclease [Bacillus anthracis]
MLIENVYITGFRNYEEATINFKPKTLIIGSNDIGKSNLLYAIRILLDKTLSEVDIEPLDSDFYAFNETNEIQIILKFINVFEDCVISNFKGKISDDNELFLAYKAFKDPITGEKSYHFEAGKSIEDLVEIKGRYYLKTLNLKYLASTRDLFTFIKKERKNLLVDIKKNRTTEEIKFDEKYLKRIDKTLEVINERVGKLNYVKKATVDINEELEKLSFHHKSQSIEFDVGAWDSSQFVDNLNLVSKVKDKSLSVSGDGRSNQLFIALWAQRNEVKKDNLLEVTFYCIEEPEAHLHPHQQRKLANYLLEAINNQVFLTTHSPQIAAEFPPDSIVRLYNKQLETKAANDGCNTLIADAVSNFGHRMSVIPAEALFANVVLLVEGQSELLFYKALANDIGIDLDRLNISILMVDGVGFDYYIDVLTTLGISFVVRTDNDFFKLPKKDTYWYAGVKRCIKIYNTFYEKDKELDELLKREKLLTQVPLDIPQTVKDYVNQLITKLEDFNLYLAEKDLEHDLNNSLVSKQLNKYFGSYLKSQDDPEIVKEMQKKKATFMFSFLNDSQTDLSVLKDHSLAKPLLSCVDIVEEENGAN